MFKLLTTSKENGHHHIVYVDDLAGVGKCSVSEGHTHEVTPELDEMGVPTGNWVVSQHLDAHTHELMEYEPREENTEDEEEVVSEQISLFRSALEYESESIKSAQESERFYMGEQWDTSLKNELEGAKRAALTINVTQKQIDELVGHQRQQRTDLRYLPVNGGDQRIADIFNVLSKSVLERNYYEREESEVFENSAIGGRGCFNLYVDHMDDVRGEPRIESMHGWDEVVFGPHNKTDLSDCEHLHKHKMFSIGKLKALWPDKLDEIEADYQDYVDNPGSKHTQTNGDQYAAGRNRTPVTLEGTKLVDIARKEYRLIETWRRIYKRGAVAYHQYTEEVVPLTGWRDSDIKAVREMGVEGLTVIEKPIQLMRITKSCGNVLLSDENPAQLPTNDFHVVPVYAHKRGNKFWGKVEIGKDPQREINKRTSQAIDIGNRMVSYGWLYDSVTFPDPEQINKFRRNASTPGFTQEVSDINNPPKQIDGTDFPSELVNLIEMNLRNHSDLMNISIAPENGDSPASILQRQRLRLVGNEYMFDNLSFGKKRLGRLLLGIFKEHYSPQRIYRIISDQNNKKAFEVGGRAFEDYSEEEILSILQTADFDKYDVVASETSWSPSERLATLMILTDLQGKGFPVPPEALLSVMDMPEEIKNEMLASIQQQQQSSMQGEQAKQEAEIQKTLIAQGVIPPKVLEQQGIQQPQGQPGMQQQGVMENQDEQGGLSGVM